MYLGKDKNKAPGTANRQTECTGCPQGSSQRIALSLFYHKAGHFNTKNSFRNQTKINFEKERGIKSGIFYNSSNRIKDSRNSNRRRRWRMGRDQSA